MTDKEILDNAPEGDGDYFVDITGEYFDEYGNHLNSKGLWSDSDASPVSPRSLLDIKRIAELEKLLSDSQTQGDRALAILKLEQQAKGLLEFTFKRFHTQTILESLSDGAYSQEDHDLVFEELKAVEVILSNKARELTEQAKALKEQGE